MINIPQPLTGKVAAAVSRFGATVKPKLRADAGGPEDQLRAPLERLLGDVAEALGVELVLAGEASLTALGVRPDYAVNVSGSRVGYVEVKAPGRGVPTVWTPNSHERRQWDQMQCRLACLGNAAAAVFDLVRTGLTSLMVAGASWWAPCWPGFLTR